MKSLAPMAAAAAVTALLLSGCSGSQAETTLEFQSHARPDSPLYAALEEAAEAFSAENPDVAIDVIAMGSTYEADMRVRLAAGDVPDIMGTHGWSRDRYGEFLQPLQDEAWAADVNPALDDAMRGPDGELYALPLDTDVAGIIVNLDVLDSVGASPDDLRTWDDFTRIATDIAAEGIAPITVGGKDEYQGNVADWLAPSFYSPEELEQLRAGTWVGEPYGEMLDVIASWRDAGLFNEDYSSATGDDMATALADGETAFVFSQNSRITAALEYDPEANLGYIPVPTLDGGTPYLIGGEFNAYGVSRDSEHRDEALAFLAFLAEPDRLAELASVTGNAPGLLGVDVELAGPLQASYEQYAASGDVPLVPYFDRVYLPNGMWDTMVATTDGIITGQQQPAAAVDQLAADYASLSAES